MTQTKRKKRVVLGVYNTKYECERFVNECPPKKVYMMQTHIMKMVIPSKLMGKQFRLVAEIL